jgi:DNA-binding NarL/FixJ family response regulator
MYSRQSSSAIWVLVVDDHSVFASNLAQRLVMEDDLRSFGTARSISGARSLLVNAVPDVVVVSSRLPDGDGVEALSEFVAVQPGARFLLLTERTADEVLVRAIEGGACGFVEKSLSLSAICAGVRAAHNGDAVIAQDLLARLLPRVSSWPGTRPVRGTPRDRNLLVLMAEGLTDAEIAERAAVKVSSVQRQVAALYTRLGAHCRLEALALATRQGLLPLVDRRREPAH